jgi:radical SAM superfamily enzyme YgiQ (UPF0313 family)
MDDTKIENVFALKSPSPPLGILYIASSLEEEGHQVEVVDFCIEDFNDNVLKKYLKNKDVIGITVRSQGINCVKAIVSSIKRINSDIPIILGGPHCTLDPINALTNIDADIVVVGDGEIVIKDVSEALEGKKNLSDISGVVYKENNKIKKGLPAKLIEDLDLISFPARHLVDKYDFNRLTGGIFVLSKGKITSMILSRGCPYNCKFCIEPIIQGKYRTRSAENIIEELKEIIPKYNYTLFIDDHFYVNKKITNQVLDFLIKEKSGMEFSVMGIRIDISDNTVFNRIKKAGGKAVSFGIESGNQAVLDYYNKGIDLNQIVKTVKLARKGGLLTLGYFMLGGPIETKGDLEKTIDFAKKLPLDLVVFQPFAYHKGSQLYNEAVTEGKIKNDEYVVVSNSKRNLGNFTEEELLKWNIMAYKAFYLRPSYFIDEIIQSLKRKNFYILTQGLKLQLKKQTVLKYNL